MAYGVEPRLVQASGGGHDAVQGRADPEQGEGRTPATGLMVVMQAWSGVCSGGDQDRPVGVPVSGKNVDTMTCTLSDVGPGTSSTLHEVARHMVEEKEEENEFNRLSSSGDDMCPNSEPVGFKEFWTICEVETSDHSRRAEVHRMEHLEIRTRASSQVLDEEALRTSSREEELRSPCECEDGKDEELPKAADVDCAQDQEAPSEEEAKLPVCESGHNMLDKMQIMEEPKLAAYVMQPLLEEQKSPYYRLKSLVRHQRRRKNESPQGRSKSWSCSLS